MVKIEQLDYLNLVVVKEVVRLFLRKMAGGFSEWLSVLFVVMPMIS
jgi:hypothetical protein